MLPPTPTLPSPPPPRNSGAVKWLLLTLFVIAAAYVGWRENVISKAGLAPAPAAAAVPENTWFVGNWFKRKDAGDGYELPILEIRNGSSGRIITQGASSDQDVGLDLLELATAADSVTFVTIGSSRTRYRFTSTAPDTAELSVVADPGHHLAFYLGGNSTGPSAHSSARREEVLREISTPRPPELVGRMVRLNISMSPFDRLAVATKEMLRASQEANARATPAKASTVKTSRWP